VHSPNKSSTNSSADDQHDTHEPSEIDEQPETTASGADQLVRIADLVARGEMPVPQHLRAEQLHSLVREVRKRRRRRLVKFIARAIALDIHRSRESDKEHEDA
jgi:hypothetical protein